MEETVIRVGASPRRREDLRFIRGLGRYTTDLTRPGECHAHFIRSPHAHAEILRIEKSAALRSAGVVDIITGVELRDQGVGPLPSGWVIRQHDGSPMVNPPHHPLAIGRVRHVGDPVAVILAESAATALDAADLIEVDYAPLPAIVSAQGATSGGSVVWEDAPDNVCADWRIGDAGAVEAAFAQADRVVRYALRNNRLVQNPLEPRAALAEYDIASGRVTLHLGSQNPHAARSAIAWLLHLPEQDLRVVTADVGGGFGAKIPIYPEECLVAWASRRYQRPVRWSADRSESFVTDAQGRDHTTVAELALMLDGTITGLRVDTLANVGAYLYGGSAAIPTFYYAPLLSGVYQIPSIFARVRLVFTNTVTVDAYRGAGRPEATYVLERLLDLAARDLDMDRLDLRRKNFIHRNQFPYKTSLGLEYDSGDHFATLNRALELADWAGFPERRKASQAGGLLRGIGVSTYVEIAGGLPSRASGQIGAGSRAEAALVRVHPSGSVTVYSGSQSTGQGHETAFSQLVGERLGVRFDQVRVVQGDTDSVPFGRGSAASRSLVIGGSAIMKAADRIIEKGARIAAYLLEADAQDIEFRDGVFLVKGTDESVHFASVARAAYSGQAFPSTEIELGLESVVYYDPVNWTFPGGCHVCEVEVDPDTGNVSLERVTAVDDVGTVINPMIVEGQIHGGLAQGIGQALYENAVYDDDGQLLSASFMDYQLPRANDLVSFQVDTCNTPCEHNPLKAKGCAEIGAVGIPPAVINAVVDALAPLGVTDVEMPATPHAVWRAINAASAEQGALA